MCCRFRVFLFHLPETATGKPCEVRTPKACPVLAFVGIQKIFPSKKKEKTFLLFASALLLNATYYYRGDIDSNHI